MVIMIDETSSSSDMNISGSLLGDYLKQKRLDKNLPLEKLSQKTKISVNILKCLESNDFDHLPSAAYIKGFVTSYARVLSLPVEDAIAKMEYTYLTVLGKPFPALNHTKVMVQTSQSKTVTAPTDEEGRSPQEVIKGGETILENTKSALPIIILVGVILFFVGGYKLISSIIEDEVNSKKNIDLGPKIESSSALVKQPVKVVEAQKTKGEEKHQSDNTTELTTATDKEKTEGPKPAEFERNFPHVDFKHVRGKLFSLKPDAQEIADPSILPEAIKNSIKADMQNVYIRATEGNTWLSYKIDNNPIVSVIVNKGSDLFLQGNEIRIFLGNVNVTKILYNNYLIETPTKSGVKSLIFPEESNSKYMLPLFPKAKDDILHTAEDYIKRMELEEEELKKRQQSN
jgi:cytoskeletal protein RodZ